MKKILALTILVLLLSFTIGPVRADDDDAKAKSEAALRSRA